jgi:hypothetical protein
VILVIVLGLLDIYLPKGKDELLLVSDVTVEDETGS